MSNISQTEHELLWGNQTFSTQTPGCCSWAQQKLTVNRLDVWINSNMPPSKSILNSCTASGLNWRLFTGERCYEAHTHTHFLPPCQSWGGTQTALLRGCFPGAAPQRLPRHDPRRLGKCVGRSGGPDRSGPPGVKTATQSTWPRLLLDLTAAWGETQTRRAIRALKVETGIVRYEE